MARTYLHLSQKDIEESLLFRVYGIKINEGDGKEKFKVCLKCGERNLPYLKLCIRCGTPLDEKELIKVLLNQKN